MNCREFLRPLFLKFDIVISLPFKSRAGVLPFLVATGLFQISSAFVSAPGPPSASTLEVLGPDSIQISYDPPISDGGSPVTSYTVITNAYQFVAPEHYVVNQSDPSFIYRSNGIQGREFLKYSRSNRL